MKKFTILLLVLSGLLVAVFFLALTQGAADIPLITIKEAFYAFDPEKSNPSSA